MFLDKGSQEVQKGQMVVDQAGHWMDRRGG